MAASTRSTLRPGYGYQPADGHARRYDAPSRGVTRYDAPTSGRSARLDVPSSRSNNYRAPSSTVGTAYDAPAARRVERDA